MRTLPAAVAAHLAARKPLLVHQLLWISARNRTSGAVETLGLWTGEDHQSITVGGQSRTYYGAGAVLGIDPVTQRSGLEVRQRNISVSPLAPEVVTAIRLYDPRLAPVELHEWFIDPDTMLPLADPVIDLRGHIIKAPISTPEDGGAATCTITMVSAAWTLTRGLTLKRSQAALERRAPGDKFRQYGDISGAVETAWGEKLAVVQPQQQSGPRAIASGVTEFLGL